MSGWINFNIPESHIFVDGAQKLPFSVKWYKGTGTPPASYSASDEISLNADTQTFINGTDTAYNTTYFKFSADFRIYPEELLNNIALSPNAGFDIYSGITNSGVTGTLRKTYYNGKMFQYGWSKTQNKYLYMSTFTPPDNTTRWVFIRLIVSSPDFFKQIEYQYTTIIFVDTTYEYKDKCKFGIWGADTNFFPDGHGYIYFSKTLKEQWEFQDIVIDSSKYCQFKITTSTLKTDRTSFNVSIAYSDDNINYTATTLPSQYTITETFYDIPQTHRYWRFTISPRYLDSTNKIPYVIIHKAEALLISKIGESSIRCTTIVTPPPYLYGEDSMDIKIIINLPISATSENDYDVKLATSTCYSPEI
jgi:hypothetical protein